MFKLSNRMGRYAFFSTDYEYKFWFAIQSSEDIWEFGGEEINEDIPEHRWTSADLEYIKAKLIVCARDNGISLPEFENYKKSIHGTYEIEQMIENQKCKDEKVSAWCSLGCIIYHQLLWNPELTARYELM